LLTFPDLPWEKDEFRESEGQLMDLYTFYFEKLTSLKYPFKVISGKGTDRLKNAVKALEKLH